MAFANPPRRTFLRGTIGLGAAAIIGAPTFSHASPIRLSFGHALGPGNPRSVAAEAFAAAVRTRTGGAVEVMVTGAEQLGTDVAMMTSLRTGALAISANAQGPASAMVPEMAALGLPFLFADSAAALRVLNGSVGEQLRARFEAVGIVTLGWWDNGIRHITNRVRPIRTPEDLRGLRIRTPANPATIDIFRALGAATTQIAFSELYGALQQGVVDGQENPLVNIASARLYEVNRFISLSAHMWESTPVLMSRMAWNRLDAAGRQAVQEAMAEATTLQVSLVEQGNARLLTQFKANPNIAVNEVDRAAFRQRTAVVVDQWERKPIGAFVRELRGAVGA